MSHSNDHSFYQTSDLGTAVFLFTAGHNLVKTALEGPRRLSFFFDRTDDTEADVAAYLNGRGEAPARRLFENYRALRAMTFQATGLAR